MHKRIIELALETLERRKAAIVTEIAELESQVRVHPKRTHEKPAAARQSQSERMKAYWARKRAGAAKAQPTKTPKSAKDKSGPQSAAARKAVSRRMKAYWKARKAAEAKAGKKSA